MFFIAFYHYNNDEYYFSIEPGEFTEWKWGDKNGPMIAALAKREIDLAGTAAEITIDRLNYVSSPTSPWPFRYQLFLLIFNNFVNFFYSNYFPNQIMRI